MALLEVVKHSVHAAMVRCVGAELKGPLRDRPNIEASPGNRVEDAKKLDEAAEAIHALHGKEASCHLVPRPSDNAQPASRTPEDRGDRGQLGGLEELVSQKVLAELDDKGTMERAAALCFSHPGQVFGPPGVRKVRAEEDAVPAPIVLDGVADEPPSAALDDVGQLILRVKVPAARKSRVGLHSKDKGGFLGRRQFLNVR